jgi:hypothetical protein
MTTIAQMKSDHGTVYSKMQGDYDDAQVQLKEIFEIARKHDINSGEGQCLIAKQFGRSIENLDVSVFPEIRTWIINNWFRKDQILIPEMHTQLMLGDNDYSRRFKEEEKLHGNDKGESWQSKY